MRPLRVTGRGNDTRIRIDFCAHDQDLSLLNPLQVGNREAEPNVSCVFAAVIADLG